MTSPATGRSSGAIREQLEKILASRTFSGSERMTRFLRFAVEATLAGSSDRLKEYTIGVEVFDRGESYDPRVEPIVRVEARRLRSKLRKYYETEGCGDELVIEFPTGSYTPRFRSREAAPSEAPGVPPAYARIAVLPFTNLSHDSDTDYFSDGLTAELIHALTKSEALCVVAWHSAQQLKGQELDYRAIAGRLNVGALLQGTVRRAGERVRITAHLIDAAAGHYLWSHAYDRRLEDVLAIQEEISQSIARVLEVQLGERPAAAPAARRLPTPEAYNLYLKGRFFWNQRTWQGLNSSIECYEKALAADPDCALAHAGLADSMCLLAEYGLRAPAEVIPRARSAATRALEIDPTLAEAATSLGFIQSLYDWQWREGEQLYRRAIELNPGYATARHWYAADYLAVVGRFDEALREIRLARQFDPLSRSIHEGEGYILMLTRRYDEALAHAQEALELHPDYYRSYAGCGRTLALMGRYDEAIRMLERGLSLASDMPAILGALGQVHALKGSAARARELLGCLERMSGERPVPTTCFAVVHLGLGEKHRALDWLETGCQRRELQMSKLKVHPIYDELRGEPRFARLLQQIGLAG